MKLNLSNKEQIKRYVYTELAKENCTSIEFSIYVTESENADSYRVVIDIDEVVLCFIDIVGLDPVFESMYRVIFEQTFDVISYHLSCIEQVYDC